ncbi:proline iminopeptidase, partial [Rozella allomycis CSF55]
ESFLDRISSGIHKLPSLIVRDIYFVVPLDYDKKDLTEIKFYKQTECIETDLKNTALNFVPPGFIKIFARHIVHNHNAGKLDELPFLIYFQGGPGFEVSPSVIRNIGWMKAALLEHQVLLLDQRGTGLSSPVTAQTLSFFDTSALKADYVSKFRTESIVADSEGIRRLLLKDKKWKALGQSFGGFCLTHYLSYYPDSIEEAYFTGGIPPLALEPDPVYQVLFPRVIEMNNRYYSRYPDDVEKVLEIARYLSHNHYVNLPNGGHLTVRRFQQLGLFLGAESGFEQLHYLIQGAFVDCPIVSDSLPSEKLNPIRKLSYKFLNSIQNMLPYETNPLYALLHESIYCQNRSSSWSAQRVYERYFRDTFEFKLDETKKLLFFGEMIFPWMFEDYAQLRSLGETAQILAEKKDWKILYLPDVLASTQTNCSAAIYYDDMYVDFNLCMQTVKCIRSIKPWITNEYLHSGIRDNGFEILKKLFDLLNK